MSDYEAAKEFCKQRDDLQNKMDKAIEKLDLLLKDLHDMEKVERETGRQFWTIELFAIRVMGVYKVLKGEDKE